MHIRHHYLQQSLTSVYRLTTSNKNNYNQKKNKNNKYRNRNYSPAKKKKELNDCVYYTGSHKQASDYEKTTEFLINYIKENTFMETISLSQFAMVGTQTHQNGIQN